MENEFYGFKKSFFYKGIFYSVQIIAYLLANETDIRSFHLSEGEFLVHLHNGSSQQSFVLYFNERLEWDSNVSKLVLDDKDLIEKIGFLIDDYYA